MTEREDAIEAVISRKIQPEMPCLSAMKAQWDRECRKCSIQQKPSPLIPELGKTIALITDGGFSGAIPKGQPIGHVSPEAADGGPIALVEEDDLYQELIYQSSVLEIIGVKGEELPQGRGRTYSLQSAEKPETRKPSIKGRT